MNTLHLDRPPVRRAERDALMLTRASYLAALWTLLYALYRGYYALGGTFGMFGVPVSESQWRHVNAIGAVILLAAAILPLILLPLWRRQLLTTALLTLCWIVTVGCVMHATVDSIQRILSLSGLLTMDFPFWSTIDRRQSDLQDLLLNEPWFLVEGVLWGIIAWAGHVRHSPYRRWWVTSVVVAVAALTVIGVLSATGVTGKLIIG